MDVKTWTYLIVGLSFALYIGIAIWSRATSTKEFYVAGGNVSPISNCMATAADWMSAASFISMAGMIAFGGYGGSVFLMGWTGGYVLLALMLAPYMRKYGKFTVPEFIGERFYSRTARIVAVICLIIVSVTYVIGQMKGVGVAFSRFLETDYNTGLYIGMAIVFFYAVLGGMKGITFTQIAQYVVLIFAYTVPAIFISLKLTGNPIPQFGLGGSVADGTPLLEKLDMVIQDLGFQPIHHICQWQQIEHVRLHDDAHDWHRRTASCNHSLLHSAKSERRALVRRLGTALHRHLIHHRSRSRCYGPS